MSGRAKSRQALAQVVWQDLGKLTVKFHGNGTLLAEPQD